eukprot:3099175-Pyramimonas_sp.AAC.1
MCIRDRESFRHAPTCAFRRAGSRHAWRRFWQRFGSAEGELPGALKERYPAPKESLRSPGFSRRAR